uniref:Truncated GIY-YIG homing endonuclease n=1 Tax=Hafniomonas laevis TaxID=436124 RepID=A0A0S2LNX5_9CHLO|nr:truncated GIY-YIG homing endonuclease [Hafniomonas laevis]ALO63099.1 truncated GIY-YIG homing endonuclease [Hafniomonas laevis]
MRGLENGTHDNSRLLKAWKTYSTQFRFLILKWGPEWNDPVVRKEEEQALIEKYRNESFNAVQGTSSPRGIIKPLMVDGTRYASSRAAARATGRSRTSLLRDARNPLKSQVYVLEGFT